MDFKEDIIFFFKRSLKGFTSAFHFHCRLQSKSKSDENVDIFGSVVCERKYRTYRIKKKYITRNMMRAMFACNIFL